MKMYQKFAILLATLGGSTYVSATETAHYYFKPYTAISYMNDVSATAANSAIDIELEKGMVLGGAFGYRYNANLAAEISWEYRSNDSETRWGNEFYPEGNYASNLIYVNGIYFFDAFGDFTPYVGVGLGWMQEIDIDLERNGVETSFSNSGKLSYQGFVGIEYRLSERWSLHTELRHAGAESGVLKDESTDAPFADLDYKPFTWQFGARYSF